MTVEKISIGINGVINVFRIKKLKFKSFFKQFNDFANYNKLVVPLC